MIMQACKCGKGSVVIQGKYYYGKCPSCNKLVEAKEFPSKEEKKELFKEAILSMDRLQCAELIQILRERLDDLDNEPKSMAIDVTKLDNLTLDLPL